MEQHRGHFSLPPTPMLGACQPQGPTAEQEHVLLSPSVSLAQHISWGFSMPPPSLEPALVLAGIFVCPQPDIHCESGPMAATKFWLDAGL